MIAAAVVKHFDDFHEDQFDFHAYCIRKVTLRSYTDVLRFEDNLWGQPYYGSAAGGIIGVYLHLHDHPTISKEEEVPDFSSMTAAERKKAKAIQRKKKKAAEKKAAEEAEKQKAKAAAFEGGDENGNKKKKTGQPVVVDTDPDGKELLKKDPIEEAKKYTAILAKHAPNCVTTWILQYDVSIRRGKALMALQVRDLVQFILRFTHCWDFVMFTLPFSTPLFPFDIIVKALSKARALQPNNSELFSRIVDFALKADTLGGDNAAVREVIKETTSTILGGSTVAKFVSLAADRAKKDPLTHLSSRVAVAKALVLTKTASASEAASVIVDGGLFGRGVTVTTCVDALAALTDFGDEAGDARTKWISQLSEKFPLAAEFQQ